MVKPIKKINLGKNGLTDSFLKQLESYFTNERVVKINVLKSACRDKSELKEIAEKIVDFLGEKYNYKIIGYVISVIKFRKKVR